MPKITRRQVIQQAGTLSAGALASLAFPGCKRLSRPAFTTPDPSSLYLIFTGAWAFCFESDGLNVVSTHYDEHTYDLGVSLPGGQPRMSLLKDAPYTVAIGSGYTKTPIQNLVSPMIRSGQGVILSAGIQRQSTAAAGRHTISLPPPTSISPVGLLKGVTINIDQSVSQIPTIVEWPSALALVYSGAWDFVTITSPAGSGQPDVNISAGDLVHSHLSFRTCVTAECNQPPDCTINCTVINHDIAHAGKVFDSLAGMFDFKGKPQPSVTFPPCIPDPSGVGGKFPVSIRLGDDANISGSEIGIPAACPRFARLHNCAASTIIAGA